MADIVFQTEARTYPRASMDWSAIWAGLFTFVAIWSVFGVLGFAIFGSANSGAAQSFREMSAGMGIWAIILTLIAKYVAGLETGKFARLDGRFEAAIHGMVMFGLSMVAAIVLTMSGSFLFGAVPAVSLPFRGVNLNGLGAGSEWYLFLALILGWLGAIVGAASAFKASPAVASGNVRDIRPAA